MPEYPPFPVAEIPGCGADQLPIIRGETKTVFTIMLMDEGMDSGDILLQQETDIGAAETYGDLHDRLANLARPCSSRP